LRLASISPNKLNHHSSFINYIIYKSFEDPNFGTLWIFPTQMKQIENHFFLRILTFRIWLPGQIGNDSVLGSCSAVWLRSFHDLRIPMKNKSRSKGAEVVQISERHRTT
jgi:hypothetical protein